MNQGLVTALFEAGDLGPLLDHFDDEGATEAQVEVALDAVARALLDPLRAVLADAKTADRAAWFAYRHDPGSDTRETWVKARHQEDRALSEVNRVHNTLERRYQKVMRMWHERRAHEKSHTTLRAALEALEPWAYTVMMDGSDFALRDKLIELVQEHGGDPYYRGLFGRSAEDVGGLDQDACNVVAWLRHEINEYSRGSAVVQESRFAKMWDSVVNELDDRPFRKAVDPKRVRALLNEPAVLHDYLMDEGWSEDDAEMIIPCMRATGESYEDVVGGTATFDYEPVMVGPLEDYVEQFLEPGDEYDEAMARLDDARNALMGDTKAAMEQAQMDLEQDLGHHVEIVGASFEDWTGEQDFSADGVFSVQWSGGFRDWHRMEHGYQHGKSFSMGAALRMVEEGDWGPLKDYLIEERGWNSHAAESVVYLARNHVLNGETAEYALHTAIDYIRARDGQWTLKVRGADGIIGRYDTEEEAEEALRAFAGLGTQDLEIQQHMSKSFSMGTAVAMAEEGDWGPLKDYFMEERGWTDHAASSLVFHVGSEMRNSGLSAEDALAVTMDWLMKQRHGKWTVQNVATGLCEETCMTEEGAERRADRLRANGEDVHVQRQVCN